MTFQNQKTAHFARAARAAVLCFGLIAALSTAARAAAPETMDLLTSFGPRPLGMGGAFAAVSGDPIGLWYNPAAALRADRASISGNHSLRHFPHGKKNLDQFDSDTVAAVVPLSGGKVLGYGFTMPGELGLDYGDTNGALEQKTKFRGREEFVAYADKQAKGEQLAAPFVAHSWSRYDGEGEADHFRGFEDGGGFGYFYENDDGVSWGVAIKGLLGLFKKDGGQKGERGYRASLRVGAAYREAPAASTLYAADVVIGVKRQPSVEGDGAALQNSRRVRFHGGVEREFDGRAFVRAGVHDGLPTYGFGGKFGSLLLDYAVVKNLLPKISGENSKFRDGHFLSYTFRF